MRGGSSNNTRIRIYLIGSYLGFRDKIISALPQYQFSDPRKHRQSCVLKLAYDDMTEAETCPVALAIFPKNKRKGVMSYAELGASKVHDNHIIVVDEDKDDPLLEKIAKQNFNSVDDAIAFLKTNPEFKRNKKKKIIKKYPQTTEHTGIPQKNIYICGTIDEKILETIDKAKKIRPEKNFILRSEDTYKDFQRITEYDLIVAHFPGHLDWDRHAMFMIGAAYPHNIPVLLIEDKDWRYPPLQAIVRRHGRTMNCLLEYITEVNDAHISREAVNMYAFFEREMKRRKRG